MRFIRIILNQIAFPISPFPFKIMDLAKCKAVERHGPNTPTTIEVVDRLKIGNNDRSATVKRRKTDGDQLRAELAEDRRVMEESKRHADELRRKTDER